MKKRVTLDLQDRDFWQLVSRAAFANPFSPERRELDLKITGTTEPDFQKLSKVVFERIKKLEDKDAANFRHYDREESEIMRTGFLFEIYHRFYAQLDQLILDQTKSGEKCCPVPFAGEILALLAKRGFAKDEALRFFGIFYQLRRAFFFIVHGLIGQAACMKELRRHLWNNVFTSDIRYYDRYLWNRMEDFSTLLLGETGTGKGAAAAHQQAGAHDGGQAPRVLLDQVCHLREPARGLIADVHQALVQKSVPGIWRNMALWPWILWRLVPDSGIAGRTLCAVPVAIQAAPLKSGSREVSHKV